MKLLKRLFCKKEMMDIVINDDLTPLEGIKIHVKEYPVNDIHIIKKIIIFTKYKDMYLISLMIQGFKIIAPFPNGTLFTDKIPLMNIKESEFDYMMNKFRESNYDINVEVK